MSVLVGLSLPLAGELISYWNLDETEGVNAADSVGENVATFQDPDVGLDGFYPLKTALILAETS